MEILPPRVIGPLSECSRSVIFENALLGATVILVRTRNGVTQEVGEVKATLSTGIVTLKNPSEEFAARDQVSVYQKTNTGASEQQRDTIEVQKSVDKFNPPQVLTHLYQCSRGFSLGAMRPGTKVEILQGPEVIATGEAIDGTVSVRVVDAFGLPPTPGTTLTARQHICPKPPPPGGGTEWIVDTLLPPVEALPIAVHPGGKIPAPTIIDGLTDCSHAVQVGNVIPGAEVVLEDADHTWWASVGPSDETSVWVQLPVALVEKHEVEVRQEVGQRCEMQPERQRYTVGPLIQLPKPELYQIDCNMTPTVFVSFLKQEADVEFEVTVNGNKATYLTKVTHDTRTPIPNTDPLPAPPMPPGATVRVRQGECDHWSEWSEPPQTAKALAGAVNQPRIAADLFACQNTVPVENIWPLSGTIRVISALHDAPISQTPVYAGFISMHVNPSLDEGDDITVEHDVCSTIMTSPVKKVKPLVDPSAGEVVGPHLYDGDTAVKVKDVTAGAYVELWDQNKPARLQTGYAPFNDSGKVTVTFTGFGQLHGGQHIYMKLWHCGRYGRNQGLPVEYRAPVLDQITPASVIAGSSPPTLTAHGSQFQPGAVLHLGTQILPTMFVSATEIYASLSAAAVATADTESVTVVNPDGKASGSLPFTVKPLPLPQITGYDKKTLVVTGMNFLHNHPVSVRIAVEGNVPDGMGRNRSDLRDNFPYLKLMSDNNGNIKGVLDPKTQLQPILIDDINGTTWLGAFPSETLSITATDGRSGGGVGGVLWTTPPFTITVTVADVTLGVNKN